MNESQKKVLKKIISWTLTILAVGGMTWYLINNRHIFENLKRISAFEIILIGLLQPVNIGIGALINKFIIDSIDQEISLSDSLLLQFANNFLNRFISQGGAIYRGAYLKTQYAFPVSKFLASVGGTYIISLMANAILGLLLSGIVYAINRIFDIYVFTAFFILLLGMVGLILFKPSFKSKKWLFIKINQILTGWNKIKKNRKLVLNIFLLSTIAAINSSIIVFIAYRSLGTDIKFLNSMFYSTISSIINIVNLTPGGLGINESILMFSSNLIGVSKEIILLGSLLLRAISMISTLSIGGISYLILNYRLQKATKNPVDTEKIDLEK